MSTFTRLSKTLKASEEILFDNTSRFVFFSDCHRGDKSRADDFAPNRDIYTSALDFYYGRGFTYIEIGDGDELWENDRFSTLLQTHRDVYLLMRKFHMENRFYMILGNHDIVKSSRKFVERNLYKYYNSSTDEFEPLFPEIKIHEGLILKHKDTQNKIFVVHGHQGDLLNDRLWPLSRFLVRYVWRHIELFHYRNPLSPARNASRLNIVEDNIFGWVKNTNRMVITGHTHRHAFARPGAVPYFNDGCCVYNGYITGIEIQNGEIMLVKWSSSLDISGRTSVEREVLAGPKKISDFN